MVLSNCRQLDIATFCGFAQSSLSLWVNGKYCGDTKQLLSKLKDWVNKTYPELGIIVCKGLALLIHSNQLALREPQAEEEAEKDDDDSESAMSEEDAKAPLEDAEDEQVGLLCSLHRSFRS